MIDTVNRTKGRGEMKRRILILMFLSWAVFGTGHPSWAARAYVTDVFEITLRTGPSLENKIISMLSSGQALEVLESRGDWNFVRLSDSSKEGWVLARYLITRLPWSMQAKSLKEENSALQAKLAQTENALGETQRKREELASELNKKSKALEEIQSKYDLLKQGAEGFLKLKRANEMNETALKSARVELEKAELEADQLRSSQMNRWFATGALVLLCGLLLGIMVGRQQKKRKSFYD